MSKCTFIIAEAGVNHNGSLAMALDLVDAAAQSGADAIKFQTFKAQQLATTAASMAQYQIANTGVSESQQEMLRRLELSVTDHERLVARCQDRGVLFMSTAFDSQSLTMLAALGVPRIKIPSGDITCAPLLLVAARLGRPMLVSTGMSTLADIEQALGVIAFGLIHQREPLGRGDFDAVYASPEGRTALARSVTLLHCVTQYPADAEAVNLRAMDAMAGAFGLPVGYSDHTLGIEIAIAAAARGAVVIEKHMTLDRSLAGPDHAASLEPQEFTQMVRAIRRIDVALGAAMKFVTAVELPTRNVARRSIVAARRIEKGEVLSAQMLTCKRPGEGISPMGWWDLLGRKASRSYEVDEPIQ